MTTDTICLKEEDIIRLIEAYFDFRGLHVSLDALERETGVLNCRYPEEALVLRHLIVDGRWRDALSYIGRLPLKEQDLKYMTFEIMKQKYVELICVYEELGNELYEDLGHAIALCFTELSTYCHCPVEYENLKKLASLTKLSQDAQYKDWNPISSRRKCFETVCSVLMELPGLEGEFTDQLMDPNRFPDLLVKGILYESCEEYCEAKASAQSESTKFHFGNLTRNKDSKLTDLNLYSWLQSVPWVKMTHLFKCRSLNVNVDKLDQPKMAASWTEKILQNSTDLPEDVAQELRRPSTSSEDLKEHFWNRKIQRNLIVDAPEILRRAEEVISRWERRNISSGKNASNKNPSKDDIYGTDNETHACAGDGKEVSKKLPNNVQTCSLQKKSEDAISASASCPRSKLETMEQPIQMPNNGTNCSEKKKSEDAISIFGNCSRSKRQTIEQPVQMSNNETACNLQKKSEDIISVSDSCSRSKCQTKEQLDNIPNNETACSLQKKFEDTISVSGSCSRFKHQTMEHFVQMPNHGTACSLQNKSEDTIFISDSCLKSKGSEEKIECSMSCSSESTDTKTVVELFVPKHYEKEKDIYVDNVPERNAGFDEKQNIRDLLKAKEAVRDKLLQILRNSTNDQNNITMTDEANDSSKNLEESNCNSMVNKLEKPSEIQQPFYMQLQLLRDEESNLERIFNPKPEKIAHNVPSPADIRKRRKQNASNALCVGFGPEKHFEQENSHREFKKQQEKSLSSGVPGSGESSEPKHNFVAVTQLEDEQAIRSVEFHPSGKFYAVGSNTKALRICAYPNCKEIRPDQEPREPTVLYKKQKHHKGSIYCMAWNATGDLLATGSNDKTVKLMRFNSNTCQLEDIAHPLTMHGGTVRDMCFMEDLSNRSNLLISGGSGDNKIYITDCETAMTFQSLTGHTGQILSLYTWGGVMFVSSSQDKTIRFWDMRTRGCVHQISSRPVGGTGPGSAAAAVSVDPSGRLLVAGHEDATCMLYDMKGNRILQTFKPHTSDIRTCRLSPKAFYLLTGSYDCKLMLTDLQGDLTQQMATVRVAEHADKVIQGRWHPNEFTFISTSADKTATLWGLPQT